MKNLQTVRFIVFSFILILIASVKIFATGGVDPRFNAGLTGAARTANVVVVQPDGRILVGGNFSVVDGRLSYGIVRLNADSTIDQNFNIGTGFNDGANVNAIAVQPGGKILVGGGFSSFNGTPRNYLVRLNVDGSLDTSFNNLGTGLVGFEVNAITLQSNNQILIGGAFNQYNGVSTFNFARLNADGVLDTTFATALGTGFGFAGNPVLSIAVETDGQIVVGGIFTNVNGTPANNIARLNAGGSLDTTFITNTGTGFNFSVNAVALQTDGRIVVGGSFSTFNGTARSNLARLNDNGTLDTNFVPVVTGGIKSIAIQPDTRIVAGGVNAQFGAFERSYIGRVEASNGSLDLNFNAGTGGNGGTFGNLALQSDGTMFTTGNFLKFNNFNTARLAKLNANGSVDTAFSVVMADHGTVISMFVQSDNRTLIGGSFVGVNGDFRGGLARLNANGTTDKSFITGLDPESSVQAIAVQSDGKILIGGFNLGELGNSTVFRLHRNGSLDTTFTASTNSIINDIAVQSDGKILIVGQLGTGIARLNDNGTPDTNFNTGGTGFSGGAPQSIVVQPNGQILVGGFFTSYNGTNGVNRIARLNANGSLDTAFTTNTGIGFDFGGPNILALQTDGKIVAGGFFVNFNGVSSNNIVRLHANGSRDASFNVGTGFNNVVNDLKLQPTGQILVGGGFGLYNGMTRNQMVRLDANGTLDPSFNANLLINNPVNAIGLQRNGKIIIGGLLLSPRIGIARLFNGDASFLTTMFDYDGDNLTDLSIYRPAAGEWWYLRSSDGQNRAFQFGNSADKIVPADYTGDEKTDIAFFRPSNGFWFVLRSEDSTFYAAPFGTGVDVPVSADFDGDGEADFAVFRPSTREWFISKSTGGTIITQFGIAGDLPVAADYDGDSIADIAIYRPSNGQWWIQRSSAGLVVYTFGNSTDKPVPADYTGDGKTDVAFFRPSTREWFVLRSEDNSFYAAPFGLTGDIPVAGDYDGDGEADFAVWRPTDRFWHLLRSQSGYTAIQFGLANDIPTPTAFLP